MPAPSAGSGRWLAVFVFWFGVLCALLFSVHARICGHFNADRKLDITWEPTLSHSRSTLISFRAWNLGPIFLQLFTRLLLSGNTIVYRSPFRACGQVDRCTAR